ncbi:MAG: S8 family peptidase, partial [Candidatus Heimdallarchaeaceae archaeon]
IIDDYLRCNTTEDGKFHKSLFRTCKNEIDGNTERKYVDIEYYKDTDSDGDFEEQWDSGVDTRQEKWQELYNEGQGYYDEIADAHGTYCLATLRQIAPAADYIFIEVEDDDLELREDAVEWLADNYDTLGVDIVTMSWMGTSTLSDEMETLATGNVITLNSAGNAGLTFTNSGNARYPCSFDNTIGVTGVFDSNHSVEEERWVKASYASSGYGVDIAAICDKVYLDWFPVPNFNYFNGTSLSCPMVAGIIALLKQYGNTYKSSETFNISLIHELFEETGDEPGDSPKSYENEMGGHFDWLDDVGSSPYYEDFPYEVPANYASYCYGWGIIDGYEMYKYFRQNY